MADGTRLERPLVFVCAIGNTGSKPDGMNGTLTEPRNLVDIKNFAKRRPNEGGKNESLLPLFAASSLLKRHEYANRK